MRKKKQKCKASDYYETPPEIYDPLHAEFHFEVDAAANKRNTKCPLFLSDDPSCKTENALTVNWPTWCTIWCNPPHSKEGRKDEFIKKASEAAVEGATVVMLLPARTGTKAFHEYIYNKPNVDIRFLKGRIKFLLKGNRTKGPGKFDSMIVVFRPTGSSLA